MVDNVIAWWTLASSYMEWCSKRMEWSNGGHLGLERNRGVIGGGLVGGRWAKVGSHEYDMNQVCLYRWRWTLASSYVQWCTKRMEWSDGGQRTLYFHGGHLHPLASNGVLRGWSRAMVDTWGFERNRGVIGGGLVGGWLGQSRFS